MAKQTNYWGPCYGSGVVTASASERGSKMGPAAYEAAMWYAGGLTSDRNQTRARARNVWAVYKTRSDSGEIEARQFDDVNNPKTPPEEDDCEMKSDGGNSPMNFSYKHKSKPAGLDEMENNHRTMLSFMEKHGMARPQFEANLRRLFGYLFEDRYN